MIAVQQRQLVLDVAKPHAAQAVGKFSEDVRLGEFVVPAVSYPGAISEPVQTGAQEGHPHRSALIFGDRLQIQCMAGYFRRKRDSNESATDQMEKTVFSNEPERPVRRTMC